MDKIDLKKTISETNKDMKDIHDLFTTIESKESLLEKYNIRLELKIIK